MAEEGKTYVCDICGQEVKVTKTGAGTLVCCNQPMPLKEVEVSFGMQDASPTRSTPAYLPSVSPPFMPTSSIGEGPRSIQMRLKYADTVDGRQRD